MNKQKSLSPSLLGLLLLATLSLLHCKSGQKMSAEDTGPPVSYASDIRPLMERSCTPCHFPEKGKKKMLDTYLATSDNSKDILKRIQLPATDEKYMPFKSKKPAFSPEEIDMFKRWIFQGKPE